MWAVWCILMNNDLYSCNWVDFQGRRDWADGFRGSRTDKYFSVSGTEGFRVSAQRILGGPGQGSVSGFQGQRASAQMFQHKGSEGVQDRGA